MTDHLEPYRRMARSIRFFPPSVLAPVKGQRTEPVSSPVADSWVPKSSFNTDVLPIEPPIDLSEHAAALVHEAVWKPTVLPIAYVIPENIGDRISRMASSSSSAVNPQPQLEPTLNGNSVHELKDDRLVYDAHRQVYVWASTIVTEPVEKQATVLEEPVAEAPVTVTEIVPEAETPVAEAVEAIAPEAETPVAEAVEAIAPETETPVAEAIEAIAPKTETPVAEAVEVIAPKTETPVAEVVEATVIETETPVAEAVEATVIEQTTDIEPVAEVEEEQQPTLIEKVSSVIEAVSTAFMHPEVVRQEVTEATTEIESKEQNTEELVTTEAAALVAEVEAAPSLIERVSAVVEVVTSTLKTSVAPEIASDSKPITVVCPNCSSTELRKNGRRQGKQRYACKDCGRQFAIAEAVLKEEQPKLEEITTVNAPTIQQPQAAPEVVKTETNTPKSDGKKKKAKGFGGGKKK